MRLYQVLLVFILLLSNNGCTRKEIVYIQTPCPKLQEWNVEPLDMNITYEVYDENG